MEGVRTVSHPKVVQFSRILINMQIKGRAEGQLYRCLAAPSLSSHRLQRVLDQAVLLTEVKSAGRYRAKLC